MSDNDLIRRGDALKAFDDNIMWGAPRMALEKLPAVPQEMTARDFVRGYSRMCHTTHQCYKCPIFAEADKEKPVKSCWFWVRDNCEKAVSIVEQWAKEHPEKKQKTYAEDFREHFKHEWNDIDNNWACKERLYNNNAECTDSPRCDCTACWNEPMPEEEEDEQQG